METLTAPIVEPPVLVGATLGRYELHYRVGYGGMASVYLARARSSEGFRKWVAVKTIHPHIATEQKFVAMFLKEARLAARLNHPNICTVFDFGEADQTYYLAMEYLHGASLAHVSARAWRSGGMPLEIAARVVADAARGLHAAHELRLEDGRPARVIHRDVSPHNLFVLYSGVTKVVDFGVARWSEAEGEHTATGEVRGKFPYMAPEQLRGEPIDSRVDVWALGVVLWEVTVGRRLFKRDNDGTTIVAVMNAPIPAPSSLRQGYPSDLEAIVMCALERSPERRYHTAQELARDLDAFLSRWGSQGTQGDVGEYVSQILGAEIDEREQLLRQVEQLENIRPAVVTSGNTAPVPAPAPAPSKPRVGAAPIIAAVVSLLAFCLAGAFVFVQRRTRDVPATPPALTTTTTTAAPSPPPATLPPPAVAATSAVTAPPSEMPAQPRTAPPAPSPTSVRPSRTSGSEHASAPPPTVPTPAPSVAGGTGSITVLSTEGDRPLRARVFEGGQLLGTTPLINVRLPTGRHSLRVVEPSGGVQNVTANIRPGGSSMLRVRWDD